MRAQKEKNTQTILTDHRYKLVSFLLQY